VIAHENLRKPKIALALDRAMAERCGVTHRAMAERCGVTRPRIVDELAYQLRPAMWCLRGNCGSSQEAAAETVR
jgi:hypothetical protein